MLQGPFHLHAAFDLAATFLFAVTGALAALRRRYDLVGIVVLALATGVGGGLLRDAVFLQAGPSPLVKDPRYLVAVLAAVLATLALGGRIHRLGLAISLVDALGLGLYAVVGTQKALLAGLPWGSALLVGVANAAGGGVLRDVLSREEPIIFQPGEFYALAALAGAAAFAALTLGVGLPASRAAPPAILLTFLVRLLSLRLGWRTAALSRDEPPPGR